MIYTISVYSVVQISALDGRLAGKRREILTIPFQFYVYLLSLDVATRDKVETYFMYRLCQRAVKQKLFWIKYLSNSITFVILFFFETTYRHRHVTFLQELTESLKYIG